MNVTSILASLSPFHPGLIGRSIAASRGHVLEHAAWARELDPSAFGQQGERDASRVDAVELSDAALAAQPTADAAANQPPDPTQAASPDESAEPDSDSATADSAPAGRELSPEERKQVEELRSRDAEVRQHEQAHLAAAGAHARGGPTYEYETGPDGRRYAIGGEVQIDTSLEETPEATIAKMEQVRAAAHAPAEPSSQDQAIAAKASAEIQKARAEQAREQGGESDPAAADSNGVDRTQETHRSRRHDASSRADRTERAGHAGARRAPDDEHARVRRNHHAYSRRAASFAEFIVAGEQLDLVA